MPIGIIFNSLVVAIGGFIGVILGNKLPKNVLEELPSIFGLSAIAMGIALIVQLANLTPVILAIILGTIIGESFQIENKLRGVISNLVVKKEKENGDKIEILITVIVLFCFSGTGVVGALNEGFTGDSTIMITKSILDFFTAITFGATVGYLVSLVAIPQFFINLLLFFSASIIIPLMSNDMLLDFKSCGGIVTLAVGFKLAKIKHFNVINIIPAIVLVIPFSYLWNLM